MFKRQCFLLNLHYAKDSITTPLDKWLMCLNLLSFVPKDMRLCLSKYTLIFSLVNGLCIFRNGVMFIMRPFFHHAFDWYSDRFLHVLFIDCSSTCNEQNQFTCEEDPYCKLRLSECFTEGCCG